MTFCNSNGYGNQYDKHGDDDDDDGDGDDDDDDDDNGDDDDDDLVNMSIKKSVVGESVHPIEEHLDGKIGSTGR